MPYDDSFYIDYTNRRWDHWNREAAFYDSTEADSFAAALRRLTSRTALAEEWDADDAGDLTYEILGSIYFRSTDPYTRTHVHIGATRSNALTADMYAMQWASIGTGPTSAHIGLPRMRNLSPLA